MLQTRQATARNPAPANLHPADCALILRCLRPLTSSGDVRVLLFGSRAWDSATPHSNFDLALLGDAPLPCHLLTEAWEALEESQLPYRVDLINYATAATALRQAFDREGIERNK